MQSIAFAAPLLPGKTEPFDVWFRDHIKGAHGMDMAEGFPPPEQVLDLRA
jgi:hypothetical protein